MLVVQLLKNIIAWLAMAINAIYHQYSTVTRGEQCPEIAGFMHYQLEVNTMSILKICFHRLHHCAVRKFYAFLRVTIQFTFSMKYIKHHSDFIIESFKVTTNYRP